MLDADALNIVAGDAGLKKQLNQIDTEKILTPHPAEAARLLATSTSEIQKDRIGSALKLAKNLNSLVVLKGAGSICATPDGIWHVNASGNPGMASAGMGDVLTGMIAALLAQGAEPKTALIAGVYLHGAAADHAAANSVGPIGLTATDTIDAARLLLNQR